MGADLKLLDNQVKVEAWDLLVDSLDRRPGTSPSEMRRGMVHDSGDVLTLNYPSANLLGDYKGGVRVYGSTKGGISLISPNHPVEVHGDATIEKRLTVGTDVSIVSATAGATSGTTAAHQLGTGSQPVYHQRCHQTVSIKPIPAAGAGSDYGASIFISRMLSPALPGAVPDVIDLVATIRALDARVKALEAKVAALSPH